MNNIFPNCVFKENTKQEKSKQVARIQGGKYVLKLRHLRKRAAKETGKIVNLSFQKLEPPGWSDAVVASTGFGACIKSERVVQNKECQ